MEIWVTLKQVDLFTNIETLLADGIGHFHKGTLIYPEKENSKIYQKVHFMDDRVVMIRKSDYRSMVQLLNKRRGRARIVSQYGVMELDTELLSYVQSEEICVVEYKVYTGKDVVLHQKLEWKFSGIND